MKKALIAASCLFLAFAPVASALEPIPGSITYGGQPRTKLKKAPIGSIVPHQFYNEYGEKVYETYLIQPDRTLKLSSRRIINDLLNDD